MLVSRDMGAILYFTVLYEFSFKVGPESPFLIIVVIDVKLVLDLACCSGVDIELLNLKWLVEHKSCPCGSSAISFLLEGDAVVLKSLVLLLESNISALAASIIDDVDVPNTGEAFDLVAEVILVDLSKSDTGFVSISLESSSNRAVEVCSINLDLYFGEPGLIVSLEIDS
jgi:hypothetical protein